MPILKNTSRAATQEQQELYSLNPMTGTIAFGPYEGMTLEEAREANKKQRADYSEEKRLEEYEQVADATRDGMNEFAEDYIKPVVQTGAYFTPAAPYVMGAEALTSYIDPNATNEERAMNTAFAVLPYAKFGKWGKGAIQTFRKSKPAVQTLSKAEKAAAAVADATKSTNRVMNRAVTGGSLGTLAATGLVADSYYHNNKGFGPQDLYRPEETEDKFSTSLSAAKAGAESSGAQPKTTEKKTNTLPEVKVTPKKESYDNLTFSKAFAKARSEGKKEFKWKGKSFHTKTKEDVVAERNKDVIKTNAKSKTTTVTARDLPKIDAKPTTKKEGKAEAKDIKKEAKTKKREQKKEVRQDKRVQKKNQRLNNRRERAEGREEKRDARQEKRAEKRKFKFKPRS